MTRFSLLLLSALSTVLCVIPLIFEGRSSRYIGRSPALAVVDAWWLQHGQGEYWNWQSEPFQHLPRNRPVYVMDEGMTLDQVCEITAVWFEHGFGDTECSATVPPDSRTIVGLVSHWGSHRCTEDGTPEQDCDLAFYCEVRPGVLRGLRPDVPAHLSESSTVIWRGCTGLTIRLSMSGRHRIRCAQGLRAVQPYGSGITQCACVTQEQWFARVEAHRDRLLAYNKTPEVISATMSFEVGPTHHVQVMTVQDNGILICTDSRE